MDDEPPYRITITHPREKTACSERPLRRAIETALGLHGTTRARINVVLVDDAEISHLNAKHLQHDGSTDVLTFDLHEEEDEAVEGEIVISIETAEAESRRRGHDLEAELALYATHGVLHLLGHDDREETDAARMHALEDEILSSIGLGAVYRRNE